MKRKCLKVFTIISFLFAFMTLIIVAFSSFFIKPINNDNAFSFDATISKIDTHYNAGTKSDCYYISSEEYSCKFLIFYKEFIIDEDSFKALKVGDKINCKVEMENKDKLNEDTIIDLVYLKKDSSIIVSLESYSLETLDNYRLMTRVASIGTLIFLTLGIMFNCLYTKNKVTKI